MRTPSLLAVAVATLSCAPLPPKAITEGEVTIPVLATERVGPKDPFTGIPSPRTVLEVVDGVVCTLRNDKGHWTATSGSRVGDPARVTVERSAEPLQVECAKEGYRTVHATLKCVSKREIESKASGGQAAILLGMLGLLTLNAQGLALLGASYDVAYGGPELDLCSYRGVFPSMVKSGEWGEPDRPWRFAGS